MTFVADQALRRQLREVAKAEDRSVSNVIRRMIEKSLNEQKPLEGNA